MKEYYLNIFKYDFWANMKLIQSLKEQNINDESVLRLLSHMVIAELVWINRIKKLNYEGLKIWDLLSLDECEKIVKEVNAGYLEYINGLSEDDFNSMMTYKNTKGIEYENTIRETLTHVGFHSAYHRGQIAKEVRRLNKEPVLTDYIAFVRGR